MSTADERDLLAEELDLVRLRNVVGEHKRRPELTRQDRTGALPLSFAQERLWFLDQLGLVGTAYNMHLSVCLQGDLDVAALERSLSGLICRHESLRTRFELSEGSPVQVVDVAKPYVLEVRDLSCLQEQDRTRKAHQLVNEAVRSQIDLSRGPVFRASLLKLTEQEHVLLMTLHHIVSDGWSLGVLNRELSELYSAYSQGRDPQLPSLPLQPVDHAIWQRAWLKGQELERYLSYWRDKLENISTLNLPTDRPRPAIASFSGALVPFDISTALSKKLAALGRAHRATLYMVLLAAFQILLSRYSGEHDIVVGSPIAGRTQQELEGLIGFFVNTLVMRTDTSGSPTFGQLLERVKETALGAYAQQELPFEKLVNELKPDRNLAQQPLFQVMFALHNFPEEPFELAGLRWTKLDREHTTAVFDIGFHIFQGSSGALVGLVEYATDLFDRISIERMAANFQVLLESIVTNPNCSIQRLPMLSDDEREQVIRKWNATEEPYLDRCLHELFTEQVERSPEATAVLFGVHTVSYGELNRRANRLARHLRALGVGPDTVVGIWLERSIEMVVAVLGVIKAGGAYLPLDPSYPSERVRHMLDNAAPRVVLTQEKLAGRLPAGRAQLLALDANEPAISVLDEENLSTSEIGATGQHLAFVMYTSGSTGLPKGTAMSNRSMVNLMEWHRRSFGSASGKRVLQFAALGFDASFQEIFSTLCTGGSLVLVDDWTRRDPRALMALLREQKIERLFIPPLMLQSLAEHSVSTGEVPERLRDVIAAGEQLRVTDEVVELFKRIDGCRLHNNYGPTETHVVTALTLSGDPGEWPALPSIGRPIANTQIYLLDEELQPVPIGSRGEIHIGGVAVARGYVGQPEMTAQRFLVDPFSAGTHARMYKTGDVGRWRADGTIEFLGRNDDQVKIRGYRVEPGEIEVHLARHAQVKEVAVIAREGMAGGKHLVAYVVRRGESDPSAEDLRAYLKEMLPEYMVPSAFVTLDSLPLTPIGKLDRSALPAPGPAAYSAQKYEAPTGQVEEVLAEIWQGLLGVGRVGRNDNFFELGGHSLLGVKVVAKVSEALGAHLSVAAVFRYPTIRQLAKIVEPLLQGAAGSPSLTIPDFESGII